MPLLLLILLCTAPGGCQAQGLETRILQLAALKAFRATAAKGYALVDAGLRVINDLENEEVTLHSDFFGSLKRINPNLPGIAQVVKAISLGLAMEHASSGIFHWAASRQWLPAGELTFLSKVLATICHAGEEDMRSLWELVTNDRLEMTDGERTLQIQGLCERISEEYHSIRELLDQVNQEVFFKQKEARNTGSMVSLYGLINH